MGIELNNEQVYAVYDLENWWNKGTKQTFEISGAAGTGKAQPNDTIIPTPFGITKIGDLKPGDYVYDRYKAPTRVLSIHPQGELTVFKVTFSSGRSTLCSFDHLWSIYKNDDSSELITLPLKEICELMNNGMTCRVPFAGINFYDELRDTIKSIDNLGYKTEMTCIRVNNGEQLYLTDNEIVTHNTTLIRYFIERLGLPYSSVMFVAFMGKAASQMARNGLPAKTIHSAIYDYREKIARDEDNKIIFKANGKPKLVPYFELKDHLSKKIKLIVVDEGSMVEEKVCKDLLSFGLPVIVLGDLNQLPPVFGKPYFLSNPDIILRQIMRQTEGNPIIWLSQQVLSNRDLKVGVYGNSAVIRKKDISEFYFKNSDIILTGTNRLRYNINNYIRSEIKNIKKLEYPHIGEKVICRKNNWSESIDNNIYLTNGTTGFVDYIYRDSFNGKTMKMDFRPDFSKKVFRNIEFDYNHMYAVPGGLNNKETPMGYLYDKMEYAYAITTHSSQGSQWGNVLYLHEDFMRDPEDRKKLLYTAITRAQESIVVVI